jgi:DNA-binding NarL/FixJ family response regulator
MLRKVKVCRANPEYHCAVIDTYLMLILYIPTAANESSPDDLEPDSSSPGVHSPAVLQRFGSLTPRQRQVLELLNVGLTNSAIARRMGITVHTVKAHRTSVMSRMHASSFANLIGMVQGLPMGRKAVRPESGKMPSVTVVGFLVRRRQSLVRSLRAGHFATTGVANGKELDAAWVNEPTDIAIVEPELDEGREDGWHIAKRILKRHTVGVILLSTRRKSFDRIKGLRMGADACFTTPVDMDELRPVLINLGRRLRQT